MTRTLADGTGARPSQLCDRIKLPRRTVRVSSIPAQLESYIAGLYTQKLFSPEEEKAATKRVETARLALAAELFLEPFICKIAMNGLSVYLSSKSRLTSPVRLSEKGLATARPQLTDRCDAAQELFKELTAAYDSMMQPRLSRADQKSKLDSFVLKKRQLCASLVAFDFTTEYLEHLYNQFMASVDLASQLNQKRLDPEEQHSARRKAAQSLHEKLREHCRRSPGPINYSQNLPLAKANLDQAVEALFLANRRLVVPYAKNKISAGRAVGMDLGDLIHEGNFGLSRAVKKFNRDRVDKFSTFAVLLIKQQIDRAILKQRQGIVSKGTYRGSQIISNAQAELSHELKRKPTDFELAARVSLKECDLPKYRRSCSSFLPSEESETSHQRGVDDLPAPDHHEDPSRQLVLKELQTRLNEALGSLPPRSQTIIRLLFLSPDQLTCEQLGRKVGLSRHRIEQLRDEALTALRNQTVWRGLQSFLGEGLQIPPANLSPLTTKEIAAINPLAVERRRRAQSNKNKKKPSASDF